MDTLFIYGKNSNTNQITYIPYTGSGNNILLDIYGTSNGAVEWNDVLNKPDFAVVATSGEYSDLLNTPTLAAVATSGEYSDLLNKPDIPASIDDLTDVQITDPVNGECLIYQDGLWVDGSYDYNDLINKPVNEFLEKVVIVNEGEKTISQALSDNPGQALHFQLSTGSHEEVGPINITHTNINISSLAACGTATLCQISQAAVNLTLQSHRIRFANIQFDGLVSIDPSTSLVNHSFTNCLLNGGLSIAAGTPTTGSRFLRFTDCEIANLSIDNIQGCDIYFIRCVFSGTFNNDITVSNKVYLLDCVNLPWNSYGLAILGGHNNFNNLTTETYFGYGSAAKLRTTLLTDGSNSNLAFVNEVGSVRRILDDSSKIANLQLVNSNIKIDGTTYVLGSDNPAFSLANFAGYNSSNLVGQLTNSQLSNSNIKIDGTTYLLGSDNPAFSLANFAGYNSSNLVGQLTNSQLSNSNIKIDGTTYVLGSDNPAFSLANFAGYNSSNLVGQITNSQLANSNVVICGLTANLGQTITVPIDALGNTTISYTGIQNHSVLAYHNATNDWRQLKLSFGDLQDVNIGNGTPNNSIVFYNSSTQQLQATANIKCNSIQFNNSNILIGQTTINSTPGTHIILNSSGSPISVSQGSSFYVSTNSIRLGAGNGYRLTYDDSTSEVTKQLNTVAALSDVGSTTDTSNGAILRWNNGLSLWERERTEYYNVCWFGQLATIATNAQRNLFQTTNWTSLTQDTAYYYPINKLTLNNLTSVISGFDSDKAYRIECHMSLNGFDITATTDLSLYLRATSSAGTILRTATIRMTADAQCPSLHNVAIVSGYTAYYYGFVVSTGTLTGTTNNVQLALTINEI